MDLEILEVLSEQVETRVSMPPVLVGSVQLFDGKVPGWVDAGKAHTFHPPYASIGASQRSVITRTHAPTCTSLLFMRLVSQHAALFLDIR
jgi:hypothetical protein